ncbi:AAA family ATPase [Candidatus Desantisbacteria bacterium]|nr:AAA family ATPase [Candidatus Desantisbacteria bacterium]
MANYKIFFGFKNEPFPHDLKIDQILNTPGVIGIAERVLYSVGCGAVSVITGDVGAGKSTALRYALSKLHPSQYRIIEVTANTGSILEVLKQICLALNVENNSLSQTSIMNTIRKIILEIDNKKQVPVLIIDEAHLIRLEIFSQLHTIGQFEMDSKAIMPIILVGQNNLIDKLMYDKSRSLASRVVSRSHLDGIKFKDTGEYIKHHLEIAGIKQQLFSDEAILAIHQGTRGLLRKTNIVARGALIAAASKKCNVVSPEHVRIAFTETI